MLTKICTSCGRELEATEENFHTKKGGKYGLHSECKECRNRKRKDRYSEDKNALSNLQNIGEYDYCLVNGMVHIQNGKRKLKMIIPKEILKEIMDNLNDER